MEQKCIYLLSNGSEDYYPKNTLTSFTNKLPSSFDFNQNEKWEVGIETIGLSCVFRNIALPKSKLHPSIIITECRTVDRLQPCPDDPSQACEHPVKFDFNYVSGCEYSKYFFEDREYSLYDFELLAKQIREETGLIFKHENNKFIFEVSVQDSIKFKSYWLMLHKSAKYSLCFDSNLLHKKVFDSQDPLSFINYVEIGGKIYEERITKYKGEEYFVYLISKRGGIDTSLISDEFYIEDRIYPNLIKVVCENIQPQILNSSFSKDLLIFSPDFKNTQKYFYKELECVDYIPLLNNSISDIRIKILDENDEQLQLLAGHATVVKLIFKKMPENKKSFNVRLTSTVSQNYPDNQVASFKVKLPTPITVDNTWKVCLNSISHPSKFSTFLPEQNSRELLFRNFMTKDDYKHSLDSDKTYTPESLISELNYFFQENSIGTISLNKHKKVEMNISLKGTLIMSIFLAKILGYEGQVVKGSVVVIKLHGTSPYPPDPTTDISTIIFKNPMDINYLKPNYIIVYSNIVKSTITGGSYSKILRMVQLKETSLDYVIKEFRNKEFCELENNEINVIEIQLRSHDGRFVNFLSENDIIVNLEFSNYLD